MYTDEQENVTVAQENRRTLTEIKCSEAGIWVVHMYTCWSTIVYKSWFMQMLRQIASLGFGKI